MYQFKDYKVHTGLTNVEKVPWAAIEEFFGLVGTGRTEEEAVRDLERNFEIRVRHHYESGQPLPPPGSGRATAVFARSDRIAALGRSLDEFWSEILGEKSEESFVSNESVLSSWEHYVSGGREEIVRRVLARYGVDITPFYDQPIPELLRRIRDGAA